MQKGECLSGAQMLLFFFSAHDPSITASSLDSRQKHATETHFPQQALQHVCAWLRLGLHPCPELIVPKIPTPPPGSHNPAKLVIGWALALHPGKYQPPFDKRLPVYKQPTMPKGLRSGCADWTLLKGQAGARHNLCSPRNIFLRN